MKTPLTEKLKTLDSAIARLAKAEEAMGSMSWSQERAEILDGLRKARVRAKKKRAALASGGAVAKAAATGTPDATPDALATLKATRPWLRADGGRR